jgi:hypothetical protein
MCLKIDWKKTIIATVIAGIVALILSVVFMQFWNIVFPTLASEYMNAMFRPWSDPWMSYVFVNPFVMAFIMSIVYCAVKDSFKSKDALKNGLYYGLLVTLFGVSGMLMTYSTFVISGTMVLSWLLSSVVQYLATGVVIAYVFKK